MQKNPYSTIGEVPLCSKQFLIQKVSKNEDRTTLKQFFKGRKLKVNENYSAMIQHTYFRKAEEMRDVFIWNKVILQILTIIDESNQCFCMVKSTHGCLNIVAHIGAYPE